MNTSIAELMAQHGDKVAAVRKRTLELSLLPHEEIVAIEAALKGAKDFPSLDGEKYVAVLQPARTEPGNVSGLQK